MKKSSSICLNRMSNHEPRLADIGEVALGLSSTPVARITLLRYFLRNAESRFACPWSLGSQILRNADSKRKQNREKKWVKKLARSDYYVRRKGAWPMTEWRLPGSYCAIALRLRSIHATLRLYFHDRQALLMGLNCPMPSINQIQFPRVINGQFSQRMSMLFLPKEIQFIGSRWNYSIAL